ncbi:adenosylmethionine decarboxylase [Novosphingobium humi]|uniref:adenosylmethionine decarboxylase n=1 Tax=Novosphingobium humi TaxID=2282397 RepID=UPI0025B1E17C|nr:adenosylmethionine decarboxylase [Novosphingobium humi]WJS99994.1 adenosylmethionine decarboxylase [Novosphingobium humi]
MTPGFTAAPATGLHLIADLAGCDGLCDVALIEEALREAAEAAHVHVLSVHLHPFGPEQGVTGVALLAESHISIHSWPEEGLAAIDIFVCGPLADAEAALAVICARLGGTLRHVQAIPRLGARTRATLAP